MQSTELVTHRVGNMAIPHRITDGYINATLLCQACDRDLSTYLRSQNTSDFLDELSRSLQICRDVLVQKIGDGLNSRRATWVHPQVAIHLGQWCSPRFAVLVSKWVMDWMTKGRPPDPPAPRQRIPVYPRRLSLAFRMMAGVPEGYWTVFDKCSNLLILVECDLNLPVERFDLLDGSVGIHWSKFRESKSWAGERIPYNHIFPDRRDVHPAWAYKLEELAHFDRWLRGVYIPIHLPAYLDKKYSMPMPAKRMLAMALGPGQMLPPQN